MSNKWSNEEEIIEKKKTVEKKIDLDGEILQKIKNARLKSPGKDYLLPEQISLSLNLTLRELEERINKGNLETKKEWTLYREGLKVSFAKLDPSTLKEMQQNYKLGIDSKSFPNIGFYFEFTDRDLKFIETINNQTLLQIEKNRKEAMAMGINVQGEERRELQGVLDELE